MMSMILLKAFTTGDFCGSGTINPIKSLNLFPSNANILSLSCFIINLTAPVTKRAALPINLFISTNLFLIVSI